MKVLLAFLLLSTVTIAATENRSATLEAIRQLENPANSASGALGELGPYQFRKETWSMYSNAPFTMAGDRQAAEEVAIRHYEWLKMRFERNGMKATPYNIALAWNGGIGAALRGQTSSGARDYARRAQNLAEDFERRDTPAAAHP